MKRLIFPALFIAVLVTLPGFSFEQKENKPLYTAHNIWFENPQEIYAINFKRGVIIPAGTRVDDVRTYSNPSSVAFVVEGYGRLNIQIVARWQPGLSKREFIDRAFSHNHFDELTAGLTEREKELIKLGQVEIGMSKKAVLISYGYPPLHKTPSLNKKIWYYWLGRIKQQIIVFDEAWKVSSISGP